MSTIENRFSELRNEYWPAIERLIRSVAEGSTDPRSPVAEMCAFHLETGGKRLRAVIPLLVAEQLGCDPAKVLPFGAACEVLHNATLVHDDLQDGDRMRRGRPTVWVKYGAPQAINLGDSMFYFTLLCVQRLEFEPAIRERAARRVLVDTLKVIDGQALEFVLKEQEVVKLVDYLRMVEGKTSGLFALPMAGAAELAGAPETTVERLSEAAQQLGVLFQIQDDVLDLYGEKGRDSTASDIREGKRSALAVHLLETAPSDKAALFRSILDTPREETTDAQVATALQLLEECGSRQWAFDELLRRRDRAVASLADHAPLQALVRGMCALFLDPVASLDPRLGG